MSLLEGHGNTRHERARARARRRARSAWRGCCRRGARAAGMAAILHKLLGLESKMRQYEVGEAFVAAVEREAGPRAIDAAWRGPECLPTVDELGAPAELAGAGRRRGVSPCTASAVRRARRRGASALAFDVLAASTAPVVVGCSGGADSLALLALACDARARAGRGARRPRPARRAAPTRPTVVARGRDAARRRRSCAARVDVEPGREPRGARPRRAVRARSTRAA